MSSAATDLADPAMPFTDLSCARHHRCISIHGHCHGHSLRPWREEEHGKNEDREACTVYSRTPRPPSRRVHRSSATKGKTRGLGWRRSPLADPAKSPPTDRVAICTNPITSAPSSSTWKLVASSIMVTRPAVGPFLHRSGRPPRRGGTRQQLLTWERRERPWEGG